MESKLTESNLMEISVMSKTILCRVPFSGFYHTLLSTLDERHFDDELDFLREMGVDEEEIPNPYDFSHNYREHYVEICRDFVENYAEENDIPLLAFQDMWSPREYNFETDQIDAEIDLGWLEGMFAQHKEKFCPWLYERMKSRDGFIPFYSNDLDDWHEQGEEWDAAEAGLLLEFLDGNVLDIPHETVEEDLYDYSVGNCSFGNYVDEAYYTIYNALVDKYEEKE